MRQNRLINVPVFFAGALVGAAIMYVLDPEEGHRRRVRAREKGGAFQRDTVRYLDKRRKDLQNRATGFRMKLEKLRRREEEIDEDVLVERVRSAIGRKLRHPGSIDVIPRARGEVILAGPCLSDEVQDVIRCAERVDGVRRVINDLDPHEKGDQIPGLQGDGKKYLNKSG